MPFSKVRDVIAGGALLLLGGFMFITSFSISSGASTGMGPAFMPRLLSGMLTVLGLIIMVGGIKNVCVKGGEKAEGDGNPDFICVILTGIFLLVYIMAIKPLGFMLSSMIYLFVQIILFTAKMEKSKKSYLLYFVISVVTAAAVFYIFTKGFKMMLPAGILG